MEVPEKITCVDCGQDAFLISYPPQEGWEIGDFISYRCRGCNDRWDLVVEEDDGNDSSSGFDFRSWLNERNQKSPSE